MENAQKEVDQLSGLMRENVLKIQERGEKLEDLELIANDLENNATFFKVNTKKLKNKNRWEENKMKIIIGASVTGAALVIIVVILLSL